MKKIILVLLLPLLMFSLQSHGQSSKNNQAKAYFFAAQEAFDNKQYDEALNKVLKVETLLGKSNALLSSLKVKVYFEQNRFKEAEAEIDIFFGFKSKASLARDISSYLIKVEKIIEEQKRKERAVLIALEEVERVAQEKARKRLAALAFIEEYTGKLVVIPAGSFQMGCVGDSDCESNEKPSHIVKLKSFIMMATEVTFEQWDACVNDGGCLYRPSDKGWGRDGRPVIMVSYDDITQQYIPWINSVTKSVFNLPSEAQWEYSARAGSLSKYNWGNSQKPDLANCDSCSTRWDSKTAPVRSFSANNWGLYDMHGNVWEWTRDCYNYNYNNAPNNGRAWLAGDCERHVIRGGSWLESISDLRSAYRNYDSRNRRNSYNGFRLVLSE